MSQVFTQRPGQNNGVGNERALFLRLFSGEVMTTFENATIMLDKHMVRTISNGKSAAFPVIGQINASYHQPGQFLGGNVTSSASTLGGGQIVNTERTIGVDNLLVSHVYVNDIDEALQHWDVRSIYSQEMGKSLARAFDNRTLRTLINCARQPSTIAGINPATGLRYFGGAQVRIGGAVDTTAANYRNALRAAAREGDLRNMPEDRMCILRTVAYWQLFDDANPTFANMNKDWGGEGSIATAELPRLFNIRLMKSNNYPTTNIAFNNPVEGLQGTAGTENTRVALTGESGPVSAYTGNFTPSVGVVFTRDAIGTVKLMDIRSESDYQLERKATLLTTDYAMGHGFLRPECAIELVTGGASAGIAIDSNDTASVIVS